MRSFVTVLTIVAGIVAGSTPVVLAETPDGPGAFPWEGEVTGNNVYVRSGAGGNWYPTDKLGLGDRVLVLGEKFGWYQIAPPDGSFSYIDKSMIERSADGKSGVLTRDKVYVRAGSRLSDHSNATQTVVDKGTRVEIIGESGAFYKIVPVHGASLYMSKQYVKFVEPRLRTGLLERYRSGKGPKARPAEPAEKAVNKEAAPETAAPARDVLPTEMDDLESNEPVVPVSVVLPPVPTEDASVEPDHAIAPDETDSEQPPDDATAIETPPAGTSSGTGRFAASLAVLESDLQAELRKPLAEQSLAEIRARYEPIALQDDEYVPSAIAKIRMRQLSDRLRLQSARAQLGSEREALEDFRAKLRRDRMELARIKADAAAAEKFDLEGELRISYAFAPEKRRYRLVDPRRNMTVAYVDIPREVGVNTKELIGRYVGIQASRRSYSPSARVSVAVASRIVDLTRDIVPKANAPSDANKTLAGYNTNETARPSGEKDGSKASAVATGPESDD